MNEIDTLLAAKMIKQLQKCPAAISTSDTENLIAGLSADKNSLHLCFNKAYTEKDKPTAEMTLDEYRSYIENKINSFFMHPQQKKVNYTIHITENELTSMQSDHKQEAYVLSSIQSAFKQPYFSPFSENCLLYFDDNDNSYSMSFSSLKNIKSCPDTFQKPSDASLETQQEQMVPDAEAEKKYVFKRMPPISLLLPSSRYAKALYAYNIAPEKQERTI